MGRTRQKTYLREWRKHREMSLEAVAAEVGVSFSNLGRIERGVVPYKQDLLESLALLYGCDPAELLARDPSAPISIFTAIARADETQRRQIEALAETVLNFRSSGGRNAG